MRHREIQIPTSWKKDGIEFLANTGSLIDGEKAYLFVVDAEGSPSPGYGPIVLNKVSSAGKSILHYLPAGIGLPYPANE